MNRIGRPALGWIGSKAAISALAAVFLAMALLAQTSATAYGAEDPYAMVSREEIEAAGLQLEAMGQPSVNGAGQPINCKTFVIYRIVAYGDPHGDIKTDADNIIQYRYLGFNFQGKAITNDLFPPDETGSAALQDKLWVTGPSNYATWGAVLQYPGMKEYILTAKVQNDGMQTGLSMTEILARRPIVGWIEKLDYMKVMSTPSVEMNGAIQLRQSNGYYDTFTVPAMKSTIRTRIDMSTAQEQYKLEPQSEFLEIPVTVTASVDYGALPEACMRVAGIRYCGYDAPVGDRQDLAESASTTAVFPVKIYRSDLQGGSNVVVLNGEGEFDSVFQADSHPILKTASKEIMVFVGPAEEWPAEPPEPPSDETEPQDITGQADLILPDFTYEGHAVLAQDDSVFTVDGAVWPAQRIYDEGLGTNRFSVMEGGSALIRRLGSTRAEMAFERPGMYTGKLVVKPDSGVSTSDQERIEVRSTPDIGAVLGGVQKQNRRQVLRISTAVNPLYPLQEFYVELQQMNDDDGEAGGEQPETVEGSTVRLTRSAPQENSPCIKTRPLAELSAADGGGFEIYSVEFLTKEPGEYRFNIFAKDSRGRTDFESTVFSVSPDLPPEAAIVLAPEYIREKGSDVAVIRAEDETVMADGDQVSRSWVLIEPDAEEGCREMADLSFGTKKKVQFMKQGVGPFEVRLRVKERWTEPTLEEYIVDGDIKTAEAAALSEVVNIAPVVSLTPLETSRARILVLAAGEREYQSLKDQDAYREEFIRNGIDADIRIERLEDPIWATEAETKRQSPGKVMSVDSDFGYEGRWTFLEEEGYSIDDRRLYVMEAAWPGTDAGDYPAMPYKLTAYDIRDSYEAAQAAGADEQKSEWICVIDQELLKIERKSQIKLRHDDTDEFLYLICGDKTLLIDKKTGAALTVLDFAAGDGNYDTERYVYSIKGTGVYAVDKLDGSVKREYAPPAGTSLSDVSRRIGGQIHLLASGPEKLIRTIFDPETEKAVSKNFTRNPEESALTRYELIGIDADGSMAVGYETPGGRTYVSGVRIFDRSGSMLRDNAKTAADAGYYLKTPVYDEKGAMTHTAFSWTRRSSTGYWFEAELHGVRDPSSFAFSKKDANGYICKNELIFARKSGDRIYLAFGAIWDHIYGTGYDYEERAALLIADLTTGSMALGDPRAIGLQSNDEYGGGASMYAAVQSSGNSASDPQFRTKVLTWPQSKWHQIGRSIQKYLRDGADAEFIVISDLAGEFDPDAAGAPAAIRQQAAAVGAELIFDRKADPVAIRDRIIGSANGNVDMLGIDVKESSGSVERQFSLESGTPYYFEYDVRHPGVGTEASVGFSAEALEDQFKIEFGIGQALPQDRFESGGYIVTHQQTEDFGDTDVNGFFSLGALSKIEQGVYKACDAANGNSDSNRIRVFEDAICFEVPVGKRAVVAFDYAFTGYQNYINGNGVEIDGERWDVDMAAEPSGQGRYLHHRILKEGGHSISSRLSYYGGLPEKYNLQIDDLTVFFIEEAESLSEESYQEQIKPIVIKPDIVSETADGGWSHVSGTFVTPPRTVAFRPQRVETLREEFEDDALIPYLEDAGTGGSRSFYIADGQYRHSYGTACEGALLFRIPAGKAARATVDTWSSIGRSHVKYGMDGRQWINGIHDSSQDDYRYIGSPYEILLPQLSGEKTLTVENSYRDRTAVEGLSLTVFEKNPLTETGRYFSADSGDWIFLENDTTAGDCVARLVFSAGGEAASGLYGLQDFKIYSIENGVRNYIADEYYSAGSPAADWEADGVELSVRKAPSGTDQEGSKIVYEKGELISYNIGYYDHEEDPSKRQYWRYTHQAFNDGMHPDAGKILESPIERFQIDGRYRVEHWQEDNTGDASYDKLSNIEEMTFYIEGGGAAPWIKSIRTVPAAVHAFGKYQLQIRIDDHEKDSLSLETEVYDRSGKLVASFTNVGIEAEGGVYPPVTTSLAEAGRAGVYRVVSTVRDHMGAGIGSISFIAAGESRAEGAVRHTDQWEQNRRRYNLSKYGVEENADLPDYGLEPRGRLVFWPGEKFVLNAETEGGAVSVTAEILGYPDYRCDLKKSPDRDKKQTTQTEAEKEIDIWEGWIWEDSFIGKWGRGEPRELTIRFTARFMGSEEDPETGITTRTSDVKAIVYASEDFWQLHRVW